MLGCGLSRWPCLTFKTSAGLNLDAIAVRRSLFRINVRASEHSSKNWIADAGKAAHLSPEQRHLQVVLVSPQIPGNTGAIARSCAATLVGLHLVEPLGFSIDSAKLKRAGLDYWPYVVVKVHGSWAEFLEFFKNQKGEKRLIAYTKRANHMYTDKSYQYGDWLLFGSETNGLPAEAIEECCSGQYAGGTVRIPMNDTYALKVIQDTKSSLNSASTLNGKLQSSPAAPYIRATELILESVEVKPMLFSLQMDYLFCSLLQPVFASASVVLLLERIRSGIIAAINGSAEADLLTSDSIRNEMTGQTVRGKTRRRKCKKQSGNVDMKNAVPSYPPEDRPLTKACKRQDGNGSLKPHKDMGRMLLCNSCQFM